MQYLFCNQQHCKQNCIHFCVQIAYMYHLLCNGYYTPHTHPPTPHPPSSQAVDSLNYN